MRRCLVGSTAPTLHPACIGRVRSPGRFGARHSVFLWKWSLCSPEHHDSNYHMAKETLLHFLPLAMSNIYRMRGEDDPQAWR